MTDKGRRCKCYAYGTIVTVAGHMDIFKIVLCGNRV